MKFFRNRLRCNLLVWLLVPLIVLFAGRSAYTFFVTAPGISTRAYDRGLESLATALSLQLVLDQKGELSLNLPEAAYKVFLADNKDKVFFSVLDSNGRMLAGNAQISPPGSDPQVDDRETFFDGVVEGEKVRVVSLKHAISPGHPEHFVVIRFAETLNKRQLLAQEIFNSSLLPQAMLIFLASLAVWFGISKGLLPLNSLKQDLSQRSHLDLRPVDVNLAPDEIKPIIHSVNELMLRLRRVLEGQSRFAGDAAHQLRTPLAGLKAQLELVSRQTSVEAMRAELKPLTTGCDRMCRLVNQMLAMARNDHEASQEKSFGNVDMNALAAEVTKECVLDAYRKEIDLGFVGDSKPKTVLGDPHRLREMVTNLIDNAIRYSPHGGHVTVSVTATPPTLIVEDNGDGIPPDERKRVFERFYRVLGNRADGSGLGLSIVQEIAHAHKASVQLDGNIQGKGTVVRVIFPSGLTH